jgi:hypothetical protein
VDLSSETALAEKKQQGILQDALDQWEPGAPEKWRNHMIQSGKLSIVVYPLMCGVPGCTSASHVYGSKKRFDQHFKKKHSSFKPKLGKEFQAVGASPWILHTKYTDLPASTKPSANGSDSEDEGSTHSKTSESKKVPESNVESQHESDEFDLDKLLQFGQDGADVDAVKKDVDAVKNEQKEEVTKQL